MTSLIECLVDPNCHGMHDDNYHFQWEKDAAMPGRYDHKLDTWKIIASSGDYSVDAESVGHAYLRFTESHPDDFVQAIISSEMELQGYKTEIREHDALCRSRISGETEDRCNCA